MYSQLNTFLQKKRLANFVSENMAGAVGEAHVNHEVPSFLLEPPSRTLCLQPSLSSDESMPSPPATTTTSSGAIVTTATTQSRRHSSVLPFYAVTPSRRQSVHDPLYTQQSAANNDRLQTLTQQLLALNVSVRYLEDSSKDWQANSTHTLEMQLEKLSAHDRTILDNQHTIQELREKIQEQERLISSKNSSASLTYQVVALALFAAGGFLLGRMT